MAIFKITIANIPIKISSFLIDIKINNKIKQKIIEFFRTSSLNTEIIFSECLNKNENFVFDVSKYLFSLLTQYDFIEVLFFFIPAEHANHKLAFDSNFFKFRLLKEQ